MQIHKLKDFKEKEKMNRKRRYEEAEIYNNREMIKFFSTLLWFFALEERRRQGLRKKLMVSEGKPQIQWMCRVGQKLFQLEG